MKMTRNRIQACAGAARTPGISRNPEGFAARRRSCRRALGAIATRALLAAGLAAPAVALAPAVTPAVAQDAAGKGVAIELNKLEPLEGACRAYLVVKNESGSAFDTLKLDLVMFDSAGVVTKRLAVQAGPLPDGKTSLKVFDITEHACPDIGSILLNDVLECAPAPQSGGSCLAIIAVSGRAEVPFIK